MSRESGEPASLQFPLHVSKLHLWDLTEHLCSAIVSGNPDLHRNASWHTEILFSKAFDVISLLGRSGSIENERLFLELPHGLGESGECGGPGTSVSSA